MDNLDICSLGTFGLFLIIIPVLFLIWSIRTKLNIGATILGGILFICGLIINIYALYLYKNNN